jgi:hypothetical protein
LLVTTVAFNSVALISVRERPKMMKKSLNIWFLKINLLIFDYGYTTHISVFVQFDDKLSSGVHSPFALKIEV